MAVGANISLIARTLLGEPDAARSSASRLAYERYSVDLKKGRIYDDEDDSLLELPAFVARVRHVSEDEASAWIASLAPKNGTNGHHHEEAEAELPDELAAERALVGLIFLKPDVLKFAEEEVAASDFLSPLHAAVFALFLDARENDYNADLKTVVAALAGEGHPAPAGFTIATYVARLAASAPFGGDEAADALARRLARQIRERAEVERGDAHPEPESTAPPPFVSQLGAVWFHEVGKTQPTRNWLFKNLLLARTFGIAYGPPGCGKSFLISDAALYGAATKFLPGDGRPHWFGYKGRPFGTVYVVAEGRDDFEIRLHAWREEHKIPRDAFLPFAFLPTSIDMRSNDVDTGKLLADLNGLTAEMQARAGVPCELVVIDTVARVLAGGNENASEVMTGFVRNCGRLQEQVGVTVLGIHHGGKEGGRGPRGHEALHGAADFELEVIGGAPGVMNQFVVRKLKAGPGGAAHKFKLRQVKVGVDTDGDAVTSCAVVPVGEQEAQNRALAAEGFALRKQEEPIFRALMAAVRQHGNASTAEQIKAGVPEGVMVADYLQWRDAYKTVAEPNADGSALSDDAIRKRFRDYQPGMVKYGVMGWCRPWLWWTGKVIRGFPETKPKPVDAWTEAGQWPDGGRTGDDGRTETGPAPDNSDIDEIFGH